MAIEYLASINLNKNELQNAVLQNVASISGAAEGQIFYDTDDNKVKICTDGSGGFEALVYEGANALFTGVSTVTPASGDFFLTLDSDGTTEQKTTVDALATLFAGSGLTATNSVIAVDTLNQDTSGTAAIATTVTVADESSDTTCFPTFVTAATGNLGPKSGSNLTFNSSSGLLTATLFAGALTGNVTGNASGTALTVTQAAQSAITSLGTLTTLTVDNVIINGTNIGHTSDTDSMAIASDGVVTFSQIPVLPANTIDSDHYVDGSIDNAHIADDAIDSEHYAAGSIDTGHIADDQVTLAKMAGLATTKFILGDGSGNPAAVSMSGDATMANDGAVIVTGSNGNFTVTGNLIVSGTSTTVNTATLTVEDPLIKLANGNTAADSVDIGLYGLYDHTGSQDVYTGFTRDASDDKWHLWKLNQAEPTTTVNKSGEGYAVDTLVANLEGDVTGDVTGNASGTALTVTQAAQTSITSLGTLTALTVDDVAVNGKVIVMTGSTDDTFTTTVGTNGATSLVTVDTAGAAGHLTITADGTVDINSAGVLTLDSGAAINIEPASGSAILLDGTISIDAGVVTGATSITSTAFVGDITGDVTGNASGTAATVTTAAQTNITSLGTLTTLTVDNVIINGSTIGHTGDTDLMTVASGILTVAGEVQMTTLDIGGTNVTATAAELNLLADTAGSSVALADGDSIIINDASASNATKKVLMSDISTYITAEEASATTYAANVDTDDSNHTLDGSNSKLIEIEHSLNTLDVMVTLVKISGGATVYMDVLRTHVDKITVERSDANWSATPDYRVLIQKIG